MPAAATGNPLQPASSRHPVNVSADTRNSIPRFPSLAVEILYHVAIGLSMDVAVVQAYGTGMKSAEYLSIHVASL